MDVFGGAIIFLTTEGDIQYGSRMEESEITFGGEEFEK